MAIDSTNVTKSYLDFNGLSELRGRAVKDSQGALRETAEQFEALFIQMMLKSMREATFKSDMLQSDALDTYQGMFDREISVSMASRGKMGMADLLQQQLGSETARVSPSSARDGVDTYMPVHKPLQAMPLSGNNAPAGGNALPLDSYAVGQPMPMPMPMPSHWTRQSPSGTAPAVAPTHSAVNAAQQRQLNDAGDGYVNADSANSGDTL
jgi:Rod binding domain-containing protein